jgi:hypothetical protein
MLEQMTVDEFTERFAAWQMSGEGDRLQHVSWIVTTICNQMTRYIATKSQEGVPDSAYMMPDELVPKHMKASKKRRRGEIRPGDKHAAERLAKHLGAI